MDCVRALDPTHFATGSQNGDVSVWDAKKKKPVFTSKAHPFGWVSAIGGVFGSDLMVSGSWKSPLVFHSLNLNKGTSLKSFKLSSPNVRWIRGSFFKKWSLKWKQEGIVADLKFSKSHKLLCVVENGEHRLGRWISLPKAKNKLRIIRLSS